MTTPSQPTPQARSQCACHEHVGRRACLELRYYGRAPVSRVAELEDPGVTASIYDLENAWWEDQETCECSCHDEEDEEAEADRQGDGRDWAEMVVW